MKKLQHTLTEALTILQATISIIDLSALKLWLNNKQIKVVRKTKLTHEKKLAKLSLSPLASGLIVDNVDFNFPNRILTTADKRIIIRFKLWFTIRRLNFSKYCLIFEKLFLQLQNFSVYRCILSAKQTFRSFQKSIAHLKDLKPMNDLFSIFTKSDFSILKSLSRDKNLYITKPDEGCGVVLLNREDYQQKVYNIINNSEKFEEIYEQEKTTYKSGG